LEKAYEVHGIIRRSSTFNTERIDQIYRDPHKEDVRLFLEFSDIADSTSLIKLLYRIQPEEIYHLAARSHVRVSFDIPEYTGDVTGTGTTRILEVIRHIGLKTKFYQASSSEMFGKAQEVPQTGRVPSGDKMIAGNEPLRGHRELDYCVPTRWVCSAGPFNRLLSE
jgi:GDPmannose 4,6-dehydratase